MNIIPFRIEHIARIRLQDQQLRSISHLTAQYADILRSGPACSAELDGQIIGSAGLIVQFLGIGTLWALVAHDAGPHLLRLHRCVRRLMDVIPLRRIEASVETDFPQGCRLLELLGFQTEGLMRSYGPDGSDHYRYSRIK